MSEGAVGHPTALWGRAVERLSGGSTTRQLVLVGACALAVGVLGGVATGVLTRMLSGFAGISVRAGAVAGLVCAASCVLVGVAFVGADHVRRRRIAGLAERVDLVLRDPMTTQPFGAYGEGELAVLENELQKMAARLRDQATGLQVERDALADSLADISHQLRTPLAAIALTLELLGRPDIGEDRRCRLTRDLRSQVDHLSWLATTLLLLARADAKALRVACEPVRVADLVREAVEPLRIALELKDQTFEAHLASGDEVFEGDPGWSREALANILKNCMEHTPAGGVLRVEASRGALATRIVVSDTGPGISAADLPHVFERFYKGEGSAPGSAGIGLALARTLVTAQGGTLTASNGIHGGARFELTFPHIVV
ncbi:MAG: HAMP domain-containing histidine kinase [Coriobacteriia bacterium]|nr:HAMP domain-containing histidine kinase [Coriobacteriia bacterium]MBS5478497.1 HAMP domain-containing histidine kinase [Coriobacteriia bacterium]